MTFVKRWAPLAVVVALLVAAVAYVEHGRRGANEAKRLAEAEALRQAGIAVAHQVDGDMVRAALKAELGRSDALAAEVAKLRKASRGARVTSTTTATTGPVPVAGAALPGSSLGCVLFEGDTGEIRLASATFTTRAGNVVFLGAAEAWRAAPAPAVRLFGGPLVAETTMERQAINPGWGVGVAGSFGRDGWRAGAAVSPPPLRLWGFQGEAVFRGEAGPSGSWGGGLTVIARRWR